jgi:hypothetical protein
MIEFIGSDIHHLKHIDVFKNNISPKAQHIFNNYHFQNKKLVQNKRPVNLNIQNTEGVF